MSGLILWAVTLGGILFLLLLTWRSAMRRRGFRLVDMLREEGILREAVDVPVRFGPARPGSPPPGRPRRGTVVLTRRRIAGFSHRARFALLRGVESNPRMVRPEGAWLAVRPRGDATGDAREVWFEVGDGEGWARDARKVLQSR
jgi:hypothetical protein